MSYKVTVTVTVNTVRVKIKKRKKTSIIYNGQTKQSIRNLISMCKTQQKKTNENISKK